MSKIERYEHHGHIVAVQSHLKGKHWDHCLCAKCKKLNLDSRDENCPIANELYALCVAHNVVTPVFECEQFEEVQL